LTGSLDRGEQVEQVELRETRSPHCQRDVKRSEDVDQVRDIVNVACCFDLVGVEPIPKERARARRR
jgi:hypothetical protein